MINKGIEYRPKSSYQLEDLPPNVYQRSFDYSAHYKSANQVTEKYQENLLRLDYLIYRAEDRIKKYVTNSYRYNVIEYEPADERPSSLNYDDFIEAARQKYYCQSYLSTAQEELIGMYEEELGSIKGDIAIDIYRKLLVLKGNIESEKELAELFKEQESAELDQQIQKLNSLLDMNLSELTADLDTKDADHKVATVNLLLNELDNLKTVYQSDYTEAVEAGKPEEAERIRDEIEYIEKLEAESVNSLSYTASHLYNLHQKADQTNNYLRKAAYMLQAAPVDNLNGTICCLLKILLKQLGIDDDVARLNTILSLDDLIDGIEAFKKLLAYRYHGIRKELSQYENKLLNLLLSPLRSVLNAIINGLFRLKSSAYDGVENTLNSVMENNMANPDSILDCFYFESFADFIYDSVDEIFEDIENKVIDLYKLFNQLTGMLDQDAIGMLNRNQIREMYKLLDKFSQTLKGIDDKYAIDKNIEGFIENFLKQNGYGETYNHRKDRFETINLGGCVDTMRYDGNHQEYLSQDVTEVPSGYFGPDYDDFIKRNPDGLNFECPNYVPEQADQVLAQVEQENQDILADYTDEGGE